MKQLISCSIALFTFMCVLVATERHAMAYVDPGSGLLALQSLASVTAAAGFFLRKRIVGLFTKKKPITAIASPDSVQKEDSRHAA
jgi:NAD/NADP transhydrogenase alpha subunit